MKQNEILNVDIDTTVEVISDAVGVDAESVVAVVDALGENLENHPEGFDTEEENTVAALLAASRSVFNPDPLHDEDSKVSKRTQTAVDEALTFARENGVEVTRAETHIDVAAAVKILNATFSPDGGNYYPPSLLRNIIAAGSAVMLAWVDGTPVGTILSLPAWGPSGSMIQSGPMAVLPNARGKKVSLALKYSQLAWASERNLTEIRWSFDMLDKRLAKLNLYSLGAEVVEFLPGFSGVRGNDDDNSIPNDRLLVSWSLAEVIEGALIPTGVERIWAVREHFGEVTVKHHWEKNPLVYLELPENIDQLRKENPEKAAAWQQAVGETLQHGLNNGYELSVTSKGAYRLLKH